MLIRGKCHCGNIAFSLTWDPDPREDPGAHLQLLVLHQARRCVDLQPGRRSEGAG